MSFVALIVSTKKKKIVLKEPKPSSSRLYTVKVSLGQELPVSNNTKVTGPVASTEMLLVLQVAPVLQAVGELCHQCLLTWQDLGASTVLSSGVESLRGLPHCSLLLDYRLSHEGESGSSTVSAGGQGVCSQFTSAQVHSIFTLDQSILFLKKVKKELF